MRGKEIVILRSIFPCPTRFFSPQGRLHNVERYAASASDPDDLSSTLVIAMKFGDGSVMMLSTKNASPHLHERKLGRKEGRGDEQSLTHGRVSISSSSPFTLPSNIIVGTGGSAADGHILRKMINDIALSCLTNDGMRSTHMIAGILPSSTLAKKISDQLQFPTQSATKGRLLSSAAIVVGSEGDDFSIWRCDPTGQFWTVHAAAVGRGAGDAEAILERAVRSWKNLNCINNNSNGESLPDELIPEVTSKDVQRFFSTISFDETLVLACKCVREALGLSQNDQLMTGIGLEGILIPAKERFFRGKPEYIHDEILQKAFHMVSRS